ncbi:haloacid dehalogenase ['Osedax' symbiont bacterium Rs2_46_30_T18]|nr:haloacid dehalogenase ['Osedax' symbiont bacterium Rs2_46_30_T18]
MTQPTALPKKIDQIKFVLSDVDDTLTSNGQLRPETYQAMHRLVNAGIIFIPITGGCAGWCDSFSRLWPAAAVIGENGGFYLKRQANNHIDYHFWQSETERLDNTQRLLQIAQEAITQVPEVRLAKDQCYRLVDVAIDYNQDISGISPAQLAKILAVFHGHGVNAKASSIHVNAWIGDYNKKAMACKLLASEFQLTAAQMQQQVLFIGDSLNDETMFEFFPNSVGVANIEQQLAQLESKPKWITQASYGQGFEQMVDAVLAD